MAHRYSLAQLTVLGWAPPEMIYNAHTLGYDCVGIRSITMGVKGENDYDIYRNREMFDLTRRAMDETGVAINDIELAKIADGVDVRNYEGPFEAAAELGVKNVISSIWTDKKDFYLDQFATLCDLAKQYGITVNLEFVTWASIRTLKETREVLDTVKRDNAGIMVDTLHLYRSRVDPAELDDCPKELFHMAHICDGPAEIPDWDDKESLIHTGRDERYYVGEGAIDIAGVVRRLPDDVVLSIELPHLKREGSWGSMEHAKRCLSTAKDYMVENGIL
ncbi:sugar phosphate isomerase/epimerase [Dethiosulfovibrio sp. F2B]|uniref:sugar phosphate isomerase/epimerase family protein n=1 Tax=Dethiosulfovibrio faecalis TaxID=2720018 RepID=UPI001F383031|nr:sugar phosphate isomerase/epimerase [Dethiosulfovibrio faecalis]MCF4150935.1 sugar phosphate isomerase/epimerase [Dethiosulfovibrio faecalis]